LPGEDQAQDRDPEHGRQFPDRGGRAGRLTVLLDRDAFTATRVGMVTPYG